MKADSELKVKLVAEYDGSGAKQAARSAEDTAETVSKANAQIEESAARAGRATEETTNRLREQKQAAKENAEEATNAGTAAEAAMNKTKAGAEGAGAAVGALPGMFSAAGKAARVFQTAAGSFFGWLALANQVIELFKKIYEWWNKKPDEEAAKKRAELLKAQRDEAEKLKTALDNLDRKRNDAALAAARLRNEQAITAEYERRAELAERAATAEDRAQMLRDERTGNLQDAARRKLDIMRLTGAITEEQHKEAIYQLEKTAEANAVQTARSDAAQDYSSAYRNKKAAADELQTARRAVRDSEARLGVFSSIESYDTQAGFVKEADGQYYNARDKRNEAAAVFQRKLKNYLQRMPGEHVLPREISEIDWNSEDLSGQFAAALDALDKRLQELTPYFLRRQPGQKPGRRMSRLRGLVALMREEEGIMADARGNKQRAQLPLDMLTKRLNAAGYDVSTPEKLRAAVQSEITNLGHRRTHETEAETAFATATTKLNDAASNFATTMEETGEIVTARAYKDADHADEMSHYAAQREEEAKAAQRERSLNADLERQQQAADIATQKAATLKQEADTKLRRISERDVSGYRNQNAATLRRDAAANLLTLAQGDKAMLRLIMRMTDPNRDPETDPVEMTDKQRRRYGTAVQLAGRGSTAAEREEIRETARAMLAAMKAETQAANAAAQVSGTQTMLDMHQREQTAAQYSATQMAAPAAADAAKGNLPPAVQSIINGLKADTQRANAEASASAQALNAAAGCIEEQATVIAGLNAQIRQFGQRLANTERLLKNQTALT